MQAYVLTYGSHGGRCASPARTTISDGSWPIAAVQVQAFRGSPMSGIGETRRSVWGIENLLQEASALPLVADIGIESV